MKPAKALIVVMLVLIAGGAPAFVEADSIGKPLDEAAPARRVMNLITPALMQVGLESSFFLGLADQIRLTAEQRSRLEAVAYEFRAYRAQRFAELRVSDAEVDRLLTRDRIDIDAVAAQIHKSAALTADVKVQTIRSLLQALAVLTHEQHMAVVLLISQELQAPKSSSEPKSGLNRLGT